jgi:hypothetical protein
MLRLGLLVVAVLAPALVEAAGPPTIVTLAPSFGSAGVPVTIRGANFTGTTQVAFNGASTSFTVTSTGVITTVAPAGVTTGQVSVTTPLGTATSLFQVHATCVVAFDPPSATLDLEGGSASFDVIAPPGCSWSVAWSGSWIRSSTVNGVGNGSVNYTVDANPDGADRDGWVQLGPRPFPIHQAGVHHDVAAGLPGVQASAAAWGDYDQDGDLDLLYTGNNAGAMTKLYRNEAGAFVDTLATLVPVDGAMVDWGDYDLDGDLDILIAGYNAQLRQVARVYRNDAGAFTDVGSGLVGVSNAGGGWGDYDNDGDLDILLVGYSPANAAVSKIYRNEGGGTFVEIPAGLMGVYAGDGAFGDYDYDGDLDVLIAGRNNFFTPVTKVYRNDGDGVFADVGGLLLGLESSTVAWGDYDGDMDLDILVAGAYAAGAGAVKVYRNDGAAFTDVGIDLSANDAWTAWVDYDRDGDLDVFVNDTRGVRWFRNNGDSSFQKVDLWIDGTQGEAALGDYDGDGDVDLFLSGARGGEVRALVYRAGTSSDGATSPGAFYPLNPCRIADTREPEGHRGGPALAAKSQRALGVHGRCGIHATARAISMNVTVTEPTLEGNVQLYPTGVAPPGTSTVNYRSGQTRANNAIVAIGALGQITVRSAQASGTAHVILDVNGYFE